MHPQKVCLPRKQVQEQKANAIHMNHSYSAS